MYWHATCSSCVKFYRALQLCWPYKSEFWKKQSSLILWALIYFIVLCHGNNLPLWGDLVTYTYFRGIGILKTKFHKHFPFSNFPSNPIFNQETVVNFVAPILFLLWQCDAAYLRSNECITLILHRYISENITATSSKFRL